MNTPGPGPGPSAGMLNLDAALHLLQQSGVALPEGAPHDAAWLQQVIDGLCDLSSRDPLTGLPNRRAFEATLRRECDRVARSGEAALLLVLDIDHFKRINDTWGHSVGDKVIAAVAQALGASVRPMDLPARIGGEEFAMILPNCSPASAPLVAERIRARVQELVIAATPSQAIGVTVSVGGAYAPQWVRSTPALWSERADLQLYRAKSEGRNRVCLEPCADSLVSSEEKSLLFGTTQPGDLT